MDAKETYFSNLQNEDDDDDELMHLTMVRSGTAYGAAGLNSSMLESSHMMHTPNTHKAVIQNSTSPQLIPSPPAAMSLRAREAASMALKHIFDAAAAAAASKDESTQIGHYTTGGFHQGMRNQSMPDLRRRVLPELDLSFKKDMDAATMMAPPAPGGFGSPISTPTPTTRSLLSSAPYQYVSPDGQIMRHPIRASSSAWAPTSRQSTAQMTIFYSGNVNVYDDVPADKAHAIMLLAGNPWSSSSRCPTPPVTFSQAAEKASLIQVVPQPPLGVVSTTIKRSSSVGSSLPTATSTAPTQSPSATPRPLPAPSALADSIMTSPRPGGSIRRAQAGIELPHARKASLARFLEKRKDRVQVQQVNADQEGVVEEKGESGGKYNGAKKPDDTLPTGKKPCTHSPSPSLSAGNVKNACDYDEEDSAANRQFVNEPYFFH